MSTRTSVSSTRHAELTPSPAESSLLIASDLRESEQLIQQGLSQTGGIIRRNAPPDVRLTGRVVAGHSEALSEAEAVAQVTAVELGKRSGIASSAHASEEPGDPSKVVDAWRERRERYRRETLDSERPIKDLIAQHYNSNFFADGPSPEGFAGTSDTPGIIKAMSRADRGSRQMVTEKTTPGVSYRTTDFDAEVSDMVALAREELISEISRPKEPGRSSYPERSILTQPVTPPSEPSPRNHVGERPLSTPETAATVPTTPETILSVEQMRLTALALIFQDKPAYASIDFASKGGLSGSIVREGAEYGVEIVDPRTPQTSTIKYISPNGVMFDVTAAADPSPTPNPAAHTIDTVLAELALAKLKPENP